MVRFHGAFSLVKYQLSCPLRDIDVDEHELKPCFSLVRSHGSTSFKEACIGPCGNAIVYMNPGGGQIDSSYVVDVSGSSNM